MQRLCGRGPRDTNAKGTTMKTYCVYVSDDHGWFDGCPDSESVFFGGGPYPADGQYVHHADGSKFGSGHVEFGDRDEAEAFADRLRESGDWAVKNPDHADFGKEDRPEYDVAEVEAEEV